MQNIILLGIIPGPSEPKNDLLKFWDGINVWHDQLHMFITIRIALICVMCDIPACRKVCGFAGHSACRGCSKCMKEFPSGVFQNKLGYDRDTWELRSNSDYDLNNIYKLQQRWQRTT